MILFHNYEEFKNRCNEYRLNIHSCIYKNRHIDICYDSDDYLINGYFDKDENKGGLYTDNDEFFTIMSCDLQKLINRL